MRVELVAKCSELFKVQPHELIGKQRHHLAVVARFALYKALRMRGWSYPEIGRRFARDHSTVFSGVKRAEAMMMHDPGYAKKIELLSKLTYNTGE